MGLTVIQCEEKILSIKALYWTNLCCFKPCRHWVWTGLYKDKNIEHKNETWNAWNWWTDGENVLICMSESEMLNLLELRGSSILSNAIFMTATSRYHFFSHWNYGPHTVPGIALICLMGNPPLCPRWAAERQRHFSDSIDIKNVFQDYVNLVEFLISSRHLPPHIGIAWQLVMTTTTSLNGNRKYGWFDCDTSGFCDSNTNFVVPVQWQSAILETLIILFTSLLYRHNVTHLIHHPVSK